MPAVQLQLDFSLPIRSILFPPDPTWQDVTTLAYGTGVHGSCLISADLLETLDEQALYDAIWTANYTLSLNHSECIRFSLGLPHRLLTIQATQTNHALRLRRVTDF